MDQNTPSPAYGDVLIVDDDSDTQQFIAEFLIDEGYAARQASNTTEAWAAVLQRTPALMLTDIVMPGVSGLALAKDLRAHGYTFPIALMTAGRLPDADLLRTYDVSCIVKPFDISVILDCVAKHVLQPPES